MKNILLSALVIFLGFGSPTAKAQTESIGTFSLQEAQNYALENSYSVKGTDYDLKVARKKVWETIADGLPQINASADYNNNLNLQVSLLPSEFFGGEPGTYTPIKFGQKYSSSASISVSQKIFDGSYIVGTMAAKVYVQLSKDQKEKSEIEIKDVVAQAYYTVLVAKENYKTIVENLAINEKLLRETDAYYQNGFREELDVDQIRLMLNTTKNQLSDAKRAIQTAFVVLKFTMGMDIDQQISLKNSLEELINPIRSEEPVISNYDLTNHIDSKIIDTQLKAQKLIIKNEQAAYLPTISAFYNYSKNTSSDYSNVFRSDVPWFKSSVIGFQLKMPIFSAWKKRSKIKQEKINYLKLENSQLMVKQNLKKDLTLSFSNLLNAQEKYENDLEGVQIAKRIYDRTRIKFNEGISTSTELSENEQQYLNSHSAYINATLGLLNSKIAFKKALGKL
ncbi:TolC family protein [Ancylomarina longa]|uniref:TolC family protein n=1 Tax=Ancylomarina longa TaxID=2487017 RepID=A0A434AFK8_9BACT|nr:TolC family protein [Ancylomarina longa]RUT73150.1 TolC family protein [Ancylomarina longa]